MGLDLPAEKRPIAVANRKMRSLNANTSANTESDVGLNSPDILNKYGAEVVEDYLLENRDIAKLVNMSTDISAATNPSLAMKFTGRLAMLDVKKQEQAYNEIETRYVELIAFLDKTGQNDLKTETLDLDAKIISSKIIYEGKNPGTIFGGHSTLHNVNVKRLGKPPTPEQVITRIEESLRKSTPDEAATAIFNTRYAVVSEQINKIGKKIDVLKRSNKSKDLRELDLQKFLQENMAAEISTLERQLTQIYKIGSRSILNIGDDLVTGVVVRVVDQYKGADSALAASKIKVTFAVNSPVSFVTLPLSKLGSSGKVQIESLSENSIDAKSLGEVFSEKKAAVSRERRYIATGNLIAAMAKFQKGRIVNFTAKNGKEYGGILLPRNYGNKNSELDEFEPTIIRDSKILVNYLERTKTDDELKELGIYSQTRLVTIVLNGDQFTVAVPKKSEKLSDTVKFDEKLHQLIGTEFAGRGKWMEAISQDKQQLDAVIERILDLDVPLYVPAAGAFLLEESGHTKQRASMSFDDTNDTNDDKSVIYDSSNDEIAPLFDPPVTKKTSYPKIKFLKMNSKHSKNNSDLFVVNLDGDMGDNYDYLNETAKRHSGFYIRAKLRSYYKPTGDKKIDGTPTFNFSEDANRQSFLDEIENSDKIKYSRNGKQSKP